MDGGTAAGFRRLADEVRVLPLGEVAPLLGYCRDSSDRARWRREGSVISVTGMKFYDHLQGRGGGGAIDLVIHARGCGAVEAIRYLVVLYRRKALSRRSRKGRVSWKRMGEILARNPLPAVKGVRSIYAN